MKLIHLAIVTTALCSNACVTMTPRHQLMGRCDAPALDVSATEKSAGRHVVLVRSEEGMGSGFVLATEDSSTLSIITNHHVVAGGRRFEIDLLTPNGKPVTLANVEVVKVDAKRDLALLRAPNPTGRRLGLTVATRSAVVGEPILVLGYPYVGGSEPTMTAERGDVTAESRVMAEQRYIQTNANVNPGNSGGPAVDACGIVIGVVVAKSTTTERTNLVIPAPDVERFLAAARAPAGSPEVLARQRLEAFLTAVETNDHVGASAQLSKDVVANLEPILAKAIKSADAKLFETITSLKKNGIDFDKLPKERQERVIYGTMTTEDLLASGIAAKLQKHEITAEEAVRRFFAAVSPAVFGKVASHRVAHLEVKGKFVLARVTLSSDRGDENWTLVLGEEWGEWTVAGFDRA